MPDHQLIVFAREDDYFFGVLHSRFHEVWSLKMGTSLGPTPRYTPASTFETFPFPFPPGTEDPADPRVIAVASAAAALHAERDVWLQTSEMKHERTLTKLYNALVAYRRDGDVGRAAATRPAESFAPRLAELHDALDRAVCAAYGWDPSILTDEEAMLARLLALNGERHAAFASQKTNI